MNELRDNVWHELQAEEALRLLDVAPEVGLADAEIGRRRATFGPNRVTARKGPAAWQRFLSQFNQPLIYILIAASAITAFLGEYVDASVIFGVVFINAVVGFIQESRAEKAISALTQMLPADTTVRRNGRKERVAVDELVPGDIVLLQSGDRVPADLRLFRVKSLQVDEAPLTGESVPVQKHANSLPRETSLADRKNMAFAGTLVTYGQAEGVVWGTGDNTETGRIATLISEAVEISTPLTRKIAHFSKLLLWVILGLAALTFAIGVWRGERTVEMFMAAISLAVAAIPEGLPAAITITLAIGVARMAKRRAIIRKLPAVETLGSTTVICSDKTGTLTENTMVVQHVVAGGRRYELTGTGYETAGEIRLDGQTISVAEHPALRECLLAGVLCNDSQVVQENGRFSVQGDPTEAALIVSAAKAGLVHAEVHRERPRVDMIPFESEHMFRATLHGGHERVVYKVGALERLLDRCESALDERGTTVSLDRDTARTTAEEMALSGLRVLAFARRQMDPNHSQLEHGHVMEGLTFLGLQGMIDPPRAEVIDAIHKCQTAGVTVKMITGDHVLTARAIASQIGLRAGASSRGQGELLATTGRELETFSQEQLEDIAERASVFARVAPEQKFRLVQALQSRGQVVAMTGDGVNDAPALKQADIGIAMGITGTEVAKGAADMVLTDDNFASIEAAVEEGRGIFDNLTKFLVWTLPTNAGQGFILLVAILVGLTLPLLPVQLLWVNMMTALLLGLMLVFEPKEQDIMGRPPRDPKTPILTAPLIMRTGLVSFIMAAGAISLFQWEQSAFGVSVDEARTIAVNTVVMVQLFYLWNCRSLAHSVLSVGLFSNPWAIGGCLAMLLAQLIFTYAPFMNRLFHTAPLSPQAWLHIVAVGLAAYGTVGLEKWIRTRRGRETGIPAKH